MIWRPSGNVKRLLLQRIVKPGQSKNICRGQSSFVEFNSAWIKLIFHCQEVEVMTFLHHLIHNYWIRSEGHFSNLRSFPLLSSHSRDDPASLTLIQKGVILTQSSYFKRNNAGVDEVCFACVSSHWLRLDPDVDGLKFHSIHSYSSESTGFFIWYKQLMMRSLADV